MSAKPGRHPVLQSEGHPAWRLLRARHAPLILSFFDQVFTGDRRQGISRPDLVEALRAFQRDGALTGEAEKYPDEWAADRMAWLRKEYADGEDQPVYTPTPAAEQALGFVRSLVSRDFVGTESRLRLLLDVMEDLLRSAETDPQRRLADLRRQQQEIDRRIRRLEAGEDDAGRSTKVRERYHQLEDLARQLPGDFRQVEENFRRLDREIREQITAAGGSKGEVLDRVFAASDAIRGSDQGRSFAAFWEQLITSENQQALNDMLNRILALQEVQGEAGAERIRHLKQDLLVSGERVRGILSRLNARLRGWLEDQSWQEDRRIGDMIRAVEQRALQLRETPPRGRAFARMDDIRPTVGLTMDRSLFRPVRFLPLDTELPEEGAGGGDFSSLFDGEYVDERELLARIDRLTAGRQEVSVGDLCRAWPPRQGLTEVLAYLRLAAGMPARAAIREDETEDIPLASTSGERTLTVPLTLFGR